MFELTINEKECQLNFGFGFIRDIDPSITRKIDGVTGKVEQLGLQYAVAGIIDGNIEDLVNVLYYGNKHADGEKISKKDIEKYLESSETDVAEIFEKVLNFLSKANCTKKTVENLQKAIEAEKAKNEQR